MVEAGSTVEQLDARANEPSAAPDEAATARIAELEAKLQTTQAARSELAGAVAAGSTRISELERDIAELRKQIVQRQRRELRLRSPSPDETATCA